MGDILMLLSNPYRPDPRVQRAAASLVQAGHAVRVVCWDRQVELPQFEIRSGIQIQRIQSVRSTYAAGWRQLFYLPRFWQASIHQGIQQHPAVVHCHDLDTLWAGWQIKRRLARQGHRVGLIFDAHEDYPALMSLYLPAVFVSALGRLESFLLKKTDAVITASQVLADKYRTQLRRGNQPAHQPPITVIGNYQKLENFCAITPQQIQAARQALELPPQTLLVTYIGGFTRNRALLPLIEASRRLTGVQVFLWGDGPQRQAVEQAAADTPNVHYLGWLDASLVPLYFQASDIIYYCLKADYPGAIYNAPNTLSNALAAGRPVIANRVGDLGRIVAETGCGILVPEVTAAWIGDAIERLRDPLLRQQMGTAGRKAAEEHYNWTLAEEGLLALYNRLLNQRRL